MKVISMRTTAAIATLALIVLLPFAASAENWPSWRGPNSDGVIRGSGYPTKWGEEENVAWKIKLPGWGTSTPAIWDQQIFVSLADEGKNSLVCLDRDGKQRWQASFGPAASNKNRKASAANPSPVTDGEHVYTYYKSGDLACVSVDGKTIWKINLQEKYGPDLHNWDLGTSPVMTKDLIVVAVMHQGPSYLLAVDKKTGEEVWKQSRDLGAPAEARDSYSTPLVLKDGDRETIIVLGADFVTAHEAVTGDEIWRVGGLNPNSARNFRSIASPVLSGGMIIAPYARGGTLTAIRRTGQGDVTDTHVAWTMHTARDSTADVPTPIAYEGKLYISGDRGDVTCVEISSGKELWVESLPRNRYVYSSSPVIAGGNLYVTREDGRTFILEVGDKPKVVGENSVRENTLATPALADGQIFLRTADYLICIGKK
jgi:outer membrane protein assembly factor BamB